MENVNTIIFSYLLFSERVRFLDAKTDLNKRKIWKLALRKEGLSLPEDGFLNPAHQYLRLIDRLLTIDRSRIDSTSYCQQELRFLTGKDQDDPRDKLNEILEKCSYIRRTLSLEVGKTGSPPIISFFKNLRIADPPFIVRGMAVSKCDERSIKVCSGEIIEPHHFVAIYAYAGNLSGIRYYASRVKEHPEYYPEDISSLKVMHLLINLKVLQPMDALLLLENRISF